jgi:hypothetical protein
VIGFDDHIRNQPTRLALSAAVLFAATGTMKYEYPGTTIRFFIIVHPNSYCKDQGCPIFFLTQKGIFSIYAIHILKRPERLGSKRLPVEYWILRTSQLEVMDASEL